MTRITRHDLYTHRYPWPAPTCVICQHWSQQPLPLRKRICRTVKRLLHRLNVLACIREQNQKGDQLILQLHDLVNREPADPLFGRQ